MHLFCYMSVLKQENLNDYTNQSKCVYVSRPEKQQSIPMCEGFQNIPTSPKLWTVTGGSSDCVDYSYVLSV